MFDADTGELFYKTEEHMVLYTMTDKGFLLFNNQPQVKMYPAIPWDLIDTDCLKLLKLAPYLSRSNVLMYSDRPMNVESMAKVFGLTANRAYVFIRTAKEKVIIKQRGSSFVVNPLYLNASGRIGESLYRLFQAELDPHLSPFIKKEVRKRWPDDTTN